uniref:MerR family transcriptional regulator n=1 Tax=Nocardia cyriacigeorgica TaxID=135487 RepID=UPI002453D4D3
MSIGELSRRTGVAVRTLRFYCDEGLLAPRRTAGGHRVFEPAVVDQVLSMRRMRALGLGLAEIAGILSGDMTIEDAIADARHEVSGRLDALSWGGGARGGQERARPPGPGPPPAQRAPGRGGAPAPGARHDVGGGG